jgi:murein DD-endopeptidase MepM/ murein hydrolase activator NlpD
VLLGSFLVVILASLFVVPLDNGQRSHTFAQTISNLVAPGQLNSINPLQHSAPPTPTTPLQMMNEGYCGGNDIWGTCATYNTQSGVMGTGHMQHPINGAIITQVFAHPEYQLWCGCWKPHTGIDLAAPYGSPIMAADSGQVIWTGWDWSGLGWAVKINHGNYIATIYGHMERFIVKVGQNVTKGQVIGYEGSTGASTGPHVHFMVLVNNIWVNPTLYVQLP